MVGAAEEVDGGFDGLGTLLDFGADGEADVYLTPYVIFWLANHFLEMRVFLPPLCSVCTDPCDFVL